MSCQKKASFKKSLKRIDQKSPEKQVNKKRYTIMCLIQALRHYDLSFFQ